MQGFQKKTETSSNDMRYEAVSCCCVSSAGFDKPGKDSHSQFVDETSTCNVSDCIFDNISFPRSIVPFMSITLNIRVSITSIHWRIFSFRLYSYLWVRWGAYSDPPSTIISFIYYLSFIHVNMENKECISYDLEQRTDIDVPVFKD